MADAPHRQQHPLNKHECSKLTITIVPGACLPAVAARAVSGDLVTNAADSQATGQASSHILRGLLALSQELDGSDFQLANSQGLRRVQLDSYNLAALRRQHERGKTTGRELVPLLLTGSIKE